MYIYPHKEEWKAEYLRESELLLSSYGKDIELHHIGSTAVRGLFAKDCIDILGVVENLSEVTARKQGLIELGYDYKGSYGIPGREYFSKKSRKVHLHIFASGDVNIKKHLHFVEVMQGNEKLIQELNSLKIHLHNKYPNDRDSYQLEKANFYNKLNELL